MWLRWIYRFRQKESKWFLGSKYIEKCFCDSGSTKGPCWRSSQHSPDLLAGLSSYF